MLLVGLRALPQVLHRNLVVILLLVFGLLAPEWINKLSGHPNLSYSVWMFVYQFILISYMRWHMPHILQSAKYAKTMLCAGLLLGMIPLIACISFVVTFKATFIRLFQWLCCASCIPSMLIALGLLSLAQQKPFWSNHVINRVASSVFATYLILTSKMPDYKLFQPCEQVVRHVTNATVMVLVTLGLSIIYFIVFIALDIIRQQIFSMTIDRRKGYWFELVWNKLTHAFSIKKNINKLL